LHFSAKHIILREHPAAFSCRLEKKAGVLELADEVDSKSTALVDEVSLQSPGFKRF